jgi:hypothetical protein
LQSLAGRLLTLTHPVSTGVGGAKQCWNQGMRVWWQSVLLLMLGLLTLIVTIAVSLGL